MGSLIIARELTILFTSISLRFYSSLQIPSQKFLKSLIDAFCYTIQLIYIPFRILFQCFSIFISNRIYVLFKRS